MSHRELPRSGRGCVSAVVLLPVVALGGVLALVLLVGAEEEPTVEQGRRTGAPVRPTLVSLRTPVPVPDDPAALMGEPPERRTVQSVQPTAPGVSPSPGEVHVPPPPPEVRQPSHVPSVVLTTTTSAGPTSSPTTPPPTSTQQPTVPATSTAPPLQPTTPTVTESTPQATTTAPTTTV